MEDCVAGTGVLYPLININVLLLRSTPHRLDILVPKAADNLQALSLLEILGARDIAVKEYSEWQVSNVDNDTLKSTA